MAKHAYAPELAPAFSDVKAPNDTRSHFASMTSVAILAGTAVGFAPSAAADNKRLNDSVVANTYTVQHQAGCTNDVAINPRLQLAAEWHARDVLHNRNLNGDIGSDGTTPQDRATAAGFRGELAQTVAINPALAISGIELINQWYYNPAYLAIMRDCGNNVIGVWSENSLDRTVVVAVYGQRPTERRGSDFRAREDKDVCNAPWFEHSTD